MKFEEALVDFDGKKEILSIEDIYRHKYFVDVIENIYCPDQNCKARLVFNKRSTGLYYLSKHKSFEHDANCEFFSDELKPVKTLTDYEEVNSDLTLDGIKRRKSEAKKTLMEFFNPPEKNKSNNKKKKDPVRKKDDSGETSVKKVIKVNYDPSGEIVTVSDKDGEISIKEPPFYSRLPHEISPKDRGKNLRTSGLIEEILITENLTEPRAEVRASFDSIKLTFVMPPSFFFGNERRVAPDIILGYLKTVKEYVEKKPKKFYLTTLCQSQELDIENILLYILDPDFMMFQTKEGLAFDSLRSMVIAISTKAI